jgi:hypothetical protein
VSPYIEENEIVSRRCSLYQEFLAVTPSIQQLNLEAKTRLGTAVSDMNPSPMERAIQRFLAKRKFFNQI